MDTTPADNGARTPASHVDQPEPTYKISLSPDHEDTSPADSAEPSDGGEGSADPEPAQCMDQGTGLTAKPHKKKMRGRSRTVTSLPNEGTPATGKMVVNQADL